jgi:short-subunit dehydrogenase
MLPSNTDVSSRFSKQIPVTNAAYGPTKAVVSWLGVRINSEDEWLNCLVLNPGFVSTDMGVQGAKNLGWETFGPMLITLETSCDGMMKVLDTTTKAKHGGKLVNYNDTVEEY